MVVVVNLSFVARRPGHPGIDHNVFGIVVIGCSGSGCFCGPPSTPPPTPFTPTHPLSSIPSIPSVLILSVIVMLMLLDHKLQPPVCLHTHNVRTLKTLSSGAVGQAVFVDPSPPPPPSPHTHPTPTHPLSSIPSIPSVSILSVLIVMLMLLDHKLQPPRVFTHASE